MRLRARGCSSPEEGLMMKTMIHTRVRRSQETSSKLQNQLRLQELGHTKAIV